MSHLFKCGERKGKKNVKNPAQQSYCILILAEALTIGPITGGMLWYCKLILPGCINLSWAVCFSFLSRGQLWSHRQRGSLPNSSAASYRTSTLHFVFFHICLHLCAHQQPWRSKNNNDTNDDNDKEQTAPHCYIVKGCIYFHSDNYIIWLKYDVKWHISGCSVCAECARHFYYL